MRGRGFADPLIPSKVLSFSRNEVEGSHVRFFPSVGGISTDLIKNLWWSVQSRLSLIFNERRGRMTVLTNFCFEDAVPMRKLFAVFLFLILPLAASPVALRSETPSPGADASLPLSSLAVPEEIGKVQERFTGRGSKTIIQIQDVHAHAVAQQNIAAILERLRTVFGVEIVALEGAWVSTSLPESHAIPTSREKQLLAGTLLEDDLISGPVYASIMSPDPISLVGIEDGALYEKNRALFLAHLNKDREIQEKLRAYGRALDDSQRSIWGPDLLAFGNAFGKFRDTSDLGKFFSLLLKTVEIQSVDTSDLAQIVLLRDTLALEKVFSKEKLEQEVKSLMREYKNTPWTLEELIRGGKIPAEKLGSYPEIKKLTRLYQMRDQISLRDLTIQIETLTGRVLERLVKTPEESALWEKTERFYLARRILLLGATPADLQYYEGEKSLVESELAGAGLSEDLALSLDFYETVKKRDEIFFDKIANDPALAGNIAVVTGGFHTDGLSQKFRDAGISYITITPELGDTSMNEKLYKTRMAEGGKRKADGGKPGSIRHPAADSQTLSELRNVIAWVDDRFPKSYKVLLQTKDVRKAVAAFLGESVTVSGSSKISQLSREGRIVPEPRTGTAVSASELRVDKFMAKPRSEQLATVRGWQAQGPERHEKAMLVSSVSVLARMLSQENVANLLKEAVEGGDIVALAQDVPATQMPEILLSTRGIDRFEAPDIASLIEKTPRFGRLAKKRPFAIMENGRRGGAYVVLPEKPISLVLFRIITLNPSLYQAAKNPVFLALLEDLTAEILSRELPKKSV